MANVMTVNETWTTTYSPTIVLKPLVDGSNIWADDLYFKDTTVNGSRTYSLQEATTDLIQASACDWNPQGSTSIGEKTITTCPLKVNLEQCYTTFEDTIFKSTLKKGSAVPDLGGTVAGDAIVAGVSEGIEIQTFDLAWFGDTDLTATSNLEYCDGYFKRFDADADIEKVEIGLGDLVAGQALTILRAVEIASKPLKQVAKSEKIYLVTETIRENLLVTYEALGTDSGLNLVQEGKDLLQFRGVEVREVLRWDVEIARNAFPDPHRVVHMKKGNLILGTDINDLAGNDMIIWTDIKDEFFRVKFHWDMGTQFFFAEYIVYAR